MELVVLGSSSKGNCYLLQNDNEALVIEAGVLLLEVKKAVDFNVSKIVGCIVSHEHGDHASKIGEFISFRVPIYGSKGTLSQFAFRNAYYNYIKSGVKFKIGNFTVLPFDVKHDAAEPLGFLIHHPETGNVLFVTDSYYIPYRFDNLNNILIEANYDPEILEHKCNLGKIPEVMKNRTLESHMSINTCVEALCANDLKQVNNIVLIHLSDGNSNEENFVNLVVAATGKKNVFAAQKGLKLKFNKTPF